MRVIAFQLLYLFSLWISQTHAASAASPPPIGNFALPSSQQPGPLYSFGQNIIDKNQAQIFVLPTYQKSPDQHFLNTNINFLYGLSADASLLLLFPFALDYQIGDHHSSGYGDTGIQGEYAFYTRTSARAQDQATLLGNVTLPAGSPRSVPATGAGSHTYFLGATYNHTTVDFMTFASAGAQFSNTYQGFLAGHKYYYQTGFSYTLKSETDHYLFLALFELDGQHVNKNREFGRILFHSGGDILYATPSLWFSTPKWIVQLGISLPVAQHWGLAQAKTDYYANASLGWTMT